MVKVADDTPESYSTAQEALSRANAALLGGKAVQPKRLKISEVHG